MSFVIDDAYLPATLNCQPMTDAEFLAFCQEHPNLNLEMTAEGELIVMAPTHFLTGGRNSEISRLLGIGRGKTVVAPLSIRLLDLFSLMVHGVPPMPLGFSTVA